MSNPFVVKLLLSGALAEEDLPLLQSSLGPVRTVQPGHDFTSQGDRPENVHLVLEGFACRYKVGVDGRQSMMALLIPGDSCDLHIAILGHMDHSIRALVECKIVEIPRTKVMKLTENPRIARALWWATLVDEAVLREWLVNVGGRQAKERIAHLFCELRVRLLSVGLADDNSFACPLTQSDLGDLMGVSNVHVSRVLKELRESGLLLFEQGRVQIPDPAKLSRFCDFDPGYLHLVPRA